MIIVLVTTTLEKVLEHVSYLTILWLFVKFKVATIDKIFDKLNWISLAEHLDGSVELLLLDALVLVALVVGLEALPGQHAPQEVHRHVADALHVVPAG